MVLANISDVIQWANPATTSVRGYAPEDLVDWLFAFNLPHEQDRALVIDQVSRLGGGDGTNVQLKLRGVRKDGAISVVSDRGSGASFRVSLPAVTGERLDS